MLKTEFDGKKRQDDQRIHIFQDSAYITNLLTIGVDGFAVRRALGKDEGHEEILERGDGEYDGRLECLCVVRLAVAYVRLVPNKNIMIRLFFVAT